MKKKPDRNPKTTLDRMEDLAVRLMCQQEHTTRYGLLRSALTQYLAGPAADIDREDPRMDLSKYRWYQWPITVSTRIDRETAEWLKDFCERHNVTRYRVLKDALVWYLRRRLLEDYAAGDADVNEHFWTKNELEELGRILNEAT